MFMLSICMYFIILLWGFILALDKASQHVFTCILFTDNYHNGESGFSKCYVTSISGRDNNSELLWIFLHY